MNRLTSDEMAEVCLANLLGLQPRRGLPEEAQKYGRGDVVQDPRIRREGGGGPRALAPAPTAGLRAGQPPVGPQHRPRR